MTIPFILLPLIIVIICWIIVGIINLISEDLGFLFSFIAFGATFYGIIDYAIIGILWLFRNVHFV